MVMGCGDIYSYSRKIKVNTRSSTETKLVSVNEYMPEVLWYLYFIQAQGYGVKYAEVHQDNVRAQIMETNGNFSSSRKTEHICPHHSRWAVQNLNLFAVDLILDKE